MAETASAEARRGRIDADPRYRALVRNRSRVTWTLTLITMAIFFGFMLLVAFDREFLGRPIGSMTTTIGIPIGLGVIVAGIVLTGIYVRYANSHFDAQVAALLEEHAE